MLEHASKWPKNFPESYDRKGDNQSNIKGQENKMVQRAGNLKSEERSCFIVS